MPLPSVTLPASITIVENSHDNPISGISVSDADGDNLTVTLSADGTFSLGVITGLTFTTGDGTDDNLMVFSGSIADLNAALASLTFTPTAEDNDGTSLTVSVSDGSLNSFSSTVDLSDLFSANGGDGSAGFVLSGGSSGDVIGWSVSDAGDVNGDGIADFIIGAKGDNVNGEEDAGQAFVVFGTSSGFNAEFDLSTLNGTNGFSIGGEGSFDVAGYSVSSAGDFNGDGIDDLLVSAPTGNGGGLANAGEISIIFGTSSGFAADINLASLDGTNGFTFSGIDEFGKSGLSVSAAGDINNDGIDDIIIGGSEVDVGSNLLAGEAYVIFGTTAAQNADFSLGSLNGSNGFVFSSGDAGDNVGRSVSAAGDLNGDGIDDIIIGAPRTDTGDGGDSGHIYVIYGSSSGFSASIDDGDLNGSNGLVITSALGGSRTGYSVSAAGDVNGDGVDDVIIGTEFGGPDGKTEGGVTYVVFGNSSGLGSTLDLDSLDGTNGFVINGIDGGDRSGLSVSSAGDVNGDGIDDLIIGAPFAEPNSQTASGESYVVFGTSSGFGATLELSSLNGTNGFVIQGHEAGDQAGHSVSSAGDINGDGIADLIIGAQGANGEAGEVFVLFGIDTVTPASVSDTLTINITPNEAPVISGDQALAVTEGNSVVISTADLSGSDLDDGASDLTFTVSNQVNGTVQVNGSNATSFTQAQLAAGQVTFLHDGSETSSGSFNVVLADNDGATAGAAVTINASVAAFNDSPVQSGDLAIAVSEGASVTLTTADLSGSDVDDADSSLIFTVSSQTNGTVQVNGVNASSFTQAQLAAGQVSFLHDGSETTSGSFNVSLADDGGASAGSAVTVNAAVASQNDAPVQSGDLSISVAEGGSVVITTTDLTGIDADDTDANLTYTVTGVSNGTVQLSGVNTSSFTQAQLAAGLVSFVHDGSELSTGSFTVSLADDDNATAGAAQTVSAIIGALNDAPVISGDLSIAVNEGASVVVTTSDLSGSDADDIDANLTFTVTNLINGIVQVNGVTATSFTQAELASGLVAFLHDGSETSSGSFDVSLADDSGASAGPAVTVNATVSAGNDAPVLSGDLNISVVEGNSVTLTTADLSGSDADDADTNLTFTVSSLVNGVVQVNGVTATSFTQAQLSSGAVTFLHDGSETSTGSFNVALSDDGGATAGSAVTVTAAVASANDAPTLSGDLSISVGEGSSVVLTVADIAGADNDDSPGDLTFTVSNLSNGTVQLNGVDTTTFSQADLAAGNVTFLHDGSETGTGSFDVALTDAGGASAGAAVTVSAAVTAQNDAPVISGDLAFDLAENGSTVLTVADLTGSDVDDANANLTFTVSNLVTGTIQVNGVTATSFTQADLASGLVRFVHDGSEATTASFDVVLSDDDGASAGSAVTVSASVTPENDAPVISGDLAISMNEGEGYTITTADLLGTDLDDAPEALIFFVISQENGSVLLNGAAATSFTQADLEAGLVSFLHDGSETTTASFNVGLIDDEGVSAGLVVTVNAAITSNNDAPVLAGDFTTTVNEGSSVVLTTADLSGTDVDHTASDLTFTIVGIENGSILVNGVAATSFTQANLAAGQVSFLHDGSETTTASIDVVLTDALGGSAGPATTISIATNAQNDAPTLTGDHAISLNEGASYTLTTVDLSGADVDDIDANLIYTISGLLNGTIQVNGVEASSFTQADLSAGVVNFVHDGTETTTGSFAVSLSDDGGASAGSATVSASITPVNDAPVVTGAVNLGVLTEDVTIQISESQLLANSADPEGASLSVLNLSVSSGSLLQVADGFWIFTPEANDDTSVTFSYAVSDGTASSSTSAVLDLLPVNDAPAFSGDLATTVSEGGSVTLTTADLNATDTDNTPDTLIYTIASTSKGVIQVNGTTATSFTQADLVAGTVTFLHDGSFDDTAGFAVSLADSAGALGGAATISIDVELNSSVPGTETADNLVGDASNDRISAGAGDDTVDGGAGADTILGGEGNDIVLGGEDMSLSAVEAQVYRIYQATLDRAPDAQGLANWVTELENGTQTLLQVIEGFVNSPEFQAIYGALNDSDFVELLYNNVLGRASDAAGLQSWLDFITNGGSRAEVVRGFSESIEFIARTDIATQAWATHNELGNIEGQIYRLYQATLDRAPDTAGFQSWITELESGTTLADIIPGFVNSAEFQAAYGSLTDGQFIALLYNNVLGREPDVAGLLSWIDFLDAGGTRAEVVRGFSESAEFISASVSGLISFMQAVNTDWNDILVGGAGDDILFGGRGADRFVFDAADDGADTVHGLEAWDILEMNGFGYANENDFADHLTQSGSDVLFSDQGVSITFTNTDVATVSSLFDAASQASPSFRKQDTSTTLQNTNDLDGLIMEAAHGDFGNLIPKGPDYDISEIDAVLPHSTKPLLEDDAWDFF